MPFPAQIFVQGETAFTVGEDTFIYADSINFSGKSASEVPELAQFGKVYKSRHTDSSHIRNKNEVTGEKSALATSQLKNGRQKPSSGAEVSVSEPVASNAELPQTQPKIYGHFPLQTATFSATPKNLAVMAGRTLKLKVSDPAFFWVSNTDLSLVKDSNNKIYYESQFSLNIWTHGTLKVRPPPVG